MLLAACQDAFLEILGIHWEDLSKREQRSSFRWFRSNYKEAMYGRKIRLSMLEPFEKAKREREKYNNPNWRQEEKEAEEKRIRKVVRRTAIAFPFYVMLAVIVWPFFYRLLDISKREDVGAYFDIGLECLLLVGIGMVMYVVVNYSLIANDRRTLLAYGSLFVIQALGWLFAEYLFDIGTVSFLFICGLGIFFIQECGETIKERFIGYATVFPIVFGAVGALGKDDSFIAATIWLFSFNIISLLFYFILASKR